MMVVFGEREICEHNLSVIVRSGASVVNIKPVFSYDSRYIIIACGSNVKIFRVKSGECIQILKHHSRPLISIRENKKNDLQVFTCSDDGLVVRWDYIEGKILQVYDLQMTIGSFYAPTASGPWFVSKVVEDHYRLYSLVPKTKKLSNVKMILKPVQIKENTLDFGYMGKYCASVFGNTLTIYKFEQEKIIRHKTGERNLTCVVCHPSELVLATGDDHGRIVVWSNALDSNHPIRSIYHWHTLPVADLAFSFEGSYLYSGGGESALVKWNLFSEERFILPRMGAPIMFVSASKDNKYTLTAHEDNALQVIDAQRTLVQVIQGLTKSPKNSLPTGLLYNPQLEALVMNGKPGHLQFYSVKQDKMLFNLDIAGKNLISQERDTTIFNMDVQKAAVDNSGRWLATAEFWSNGDTSPQIWLKFWMFDLKKQTFVLNTNVILPHNKELNCILFRPYLEPTSSPLAVTTSSDGRFKIWTLGNDSSGRDPSWSCESMGCYRDLPAGSASFSEEGSLLAVAFGSAATLWNVEGMALQAVLYNDRNKISIKQLIFGRHSCCQFLVCQDGASITVWNVLTLSIAWIVHNNVQVLSADVYSSHVAAFCKDQKLIIFTPDNPKPLRSFEKVSESPIMSCIFVPFGSPEKTESSCFHYTSQLFFINESQNLFSVSESSEMEREDEKSEKKIVQHIVETPFGMLQAEHRTTSVQKVGMESLCITEDRAEKHIVQNPSLQNASVLCSAILPSLLINEAKYEKINEVDSHLQGERMEWSDSASIHKDKLNVEDLEPKILDFSYLLKTVAFSS